MTPTGWVIHDVIEALDDGESLITALQDAIVLVVEDHGQPIRLESHLIGKAVFKYRRLQPSWAYTQDPYLRQTIDYVQHCLREAFHVCRYAQWGGTYLAHLERECSPACRQHATRPTELKRGHCPQCFLELTTTNHCPGGCDD